MSRYDGKAVAAAGKRSREELLGNTTIDDTHSCATPKALALLEVMRKEARSDAESKIRASKTAANVVDAERTALPFPAEHEAHSVESWPVEPSIGAEVEAQQATSSGALPGKQYLSKAERRRVKKQRSRR